MSDGSSGFAAARERRSMDGWSPTPARLQELVRRRDKKERTGRKVPPRYWRDCEHFLKKTRVFLKLFN